MSAGLAATLTQMAEMSQKAATKTLGVVGDDLAVSCNQLIGGQRERKIPMVAKVVKGSLRNKAIMIPCALALSLTLPGLIVPILTVGGACLCFDSVDKLLNKKLKPLPKQVSESYAKDHAAWERRHVKRALNTDLLLSAEITTVSLFTVAGMPFLVQFAALAAAGLAMTLGVYGVVAGLLKLDDIGDSLAQAQGKNPLAKAARLAGKVLGHAAPKIIKTVGVIGTIAMFTVGGGMLVHGIPGAAALMNGVLGTLNPLIQGALSVVADTVVGVAAGFIALPVGRTLWTPISKAWNVAKALKQKILPSAPAPDDGEDEIPEPAAPTLAPVVGPEIAKAPLASAPDVKASLNAAAAPPVALPVVTVLPPADKTAAPANDDTAKPSEQKALPAGKKSGP